MRHSCDTGATHGPHSTHDLKGGHVSLPPSRIRAGGWRFTTPSQATHPLKSLQIVPNELVRRPGYTVFEVERRNVLHQPGRHGSSWAFPYAGSLSARPCQPGATQ
ncbi:hypothetical protein MTBSS4_230057 [Magnetospirillum sp. SS-4]|nr:hypothetical protein MTBSS4_230057 [Magnetospirillum sp. SS-4]